MLPCGEMYTMFPVLAINFKKNMIDYENESGDCGLGRALCGDCADCAGV